MRREAQQRWLEQMTRASGALTSSLDYDATLQQVVRLPLPSLADWCMVYIPDDGGALPARLMLAHARPGKEALLRTIWDREWSILPEQHPIAECLRKCSPTVVSDCDERTLERLGSLPEHTPLLRRVGLRSLLVVPLVAHGTVIGGLLLAAATARRPAYDAEWLEPVTSVREHRRERGRVLTWPGTLSGGPPETRARGRDLHAFAARLEEIAYRLGSAVDPYAARF